MFFFPIPLDVFAEHATFSLTQADTVQRVEVDMMLRTVLEFKQNESAQIVLVTHSLAMLWFLEGDHKKVK